MADVEKEFLSLFEELKEKIREEGYSYLRDKNGTADFNQWPDHQVWDEAERKASFVFYIHQKHAGCIRIIRAEAS